MKKTLLIFVLALFPIFNIWAHESTNNHSSWNLDPFVLFSLLLLSLGYIRGQRNLKKKRPKGGPVFFLISLLFLLMALVSPINFWSEELQSWHMIQHMLIMMLAAPFFVLAAPLYVYFWALPLFIRLRIAPFYKWLYGNRSGWYFFWHPILMWTIFAFTLWIWHLPRFYQAALTTPWLHDIQHITFFISSCLFWRILLDPIHRFKLGSALGIMYLFATTLHATLLGVFMTLAPSVWYPFYQKQVTQWGLSPLEDQQLAGLIMWMPACMIYVFATAFIFIGWSKIKDKSYS